MPSSAPPPNTRRPSAGASTRNAPMYSCGVYGAGSMFAEVRHGPGSPPVEPVSATGPVSVVALLSVVELLVDPPLESLPTTIVVSPPCVLSSLPLSLLWPPPFGPQPSNAQPSNHRRPLAVTATAYSDTLPVGDAQRMRRKMARSAIAARPDRAAADYARPVTSAA